MQSRLFFLCASALKVFVSPPRAVCTAVICAFVSTLLLFFSSGSMAAETSRAKEKKQAEAARSELTQKLKSLKKDISKTESAKEKASDALEDSEQAISDANRSLRELQTEQTQAELHLNQLIAEQARLNAQVEKQKNRLAEFLRRQYQHGDSDRIKLLLSGDNPNRINRELQYMGYVSQTQAKMIAALRNSLEEIEKNKLEAQATKDDLEEIAQEERSHKQGLEKEQKRRIVLLNDLANKLHAQKKEADSLQKDEQRLSSLVVRLNKLIEEQAKIDQARLAAEKAAEKQRKEKLALEQTERKKNRLAGLKNKPNTTTNTEAATPIIVDKTPEIGKDFSLPSAQEFSQLKGQLRLPVKGELIAKFGNKRGDGPSWKGLFIKANEGAEVKAIANGKVVFAEWLRGFGNMLILDHGGQYWSVYSNNQAVLKRVGDAVKIGETIANAGNSGGNEESGLYFEMRYQGRVFDPLSWIRK